MAGESAHLKACMPWGLMVMGPILTMAGRGGEARRGGLRFTRQLQLLPEVPVSRYPGPDAVQSRTRKGFGLHGQKRG